MSPLLSIIIPVYNTGSLLRRCLDSILNQSFQDWEAVFVNDGSTDPETISICNEYTDKDPRLKAIHKANAGVSAARNCGLEKATGTWVCFIDSDDWIEPDYLQNFINQIPQGPDLVLQGYIKERGDLLIDRRHLADDRGINEGINTYFLENNLLDFGSPWCKLFKRKIICENNLLFPDDYCYGEDTVFFFRYLEYCNVLSGIGQEGYHYVEDLSGSLSRKTHHSMQLLRFIIDNTLALRRWTTGDAGKIIRQIQNTKNVALANRAYINMFKLGYDKERKRDVILFFKKRVRPLLKSSDISLHDRIFLLLTALPEEIQLLLLMMLKCLNIIKA